MGQCWTGFAPEVIPCCFHCRKKAKKPWEEMSKAQRAKWLRRDGVVSCTRCNRKWFANEARYRQERLAYEKKKKKIYPKPSDNFKPLKRLRSGKQWDNTCSFREPWSPPSSLRRMLSAIRISQQKNPAKYVGVQRKPTGFVPAHSVHSTHEEPLHSAPSGLGSLPAAAELEVLQEEELRDEVQAERGEGQQASAVTSPLPRAVQRCPPQHPPARLAQRPPASWQSAAASPLYHTHSAPAAVAGGELGQAGPVLAANGQGRQKAEAVAGTLGAEQLEGAKFEFAAQLATLDELRSVELVEESSLGSQLSSSVFVHISAERATRPLPLPEQQGGSGSGSGSGSSGKAHAARGEALACSGVGVGVGGVGGGGSDIAGDSSPEVVSLGGTSKVLVDPQHSSTDASSRDCHALDDTSHAAAAADAGAGAWQRRWVQSEAWLVPAEGSRAPNLQEEEEQQQQRRHECVEIQPRHVPGKQLLQQLPPQLSVSSCSLSGLGRQEGKALPGPAVSLEDEEASWAPLTPDMSPDNTVALLARHLD